MVSCHDGELTKVSYDHGVHAVAQTCMAWELPPSSVR